MEREIATARALKIQLAISVIWPAIGIAQICALGLYVRFNFCGSRGRVLTSVVGERAAGSESGYEGSGAERITNGAHA